MPAMYSTDKVNSSNGVDNAANVKYATLCTLRVSFNVGKVVGKLSLKAYCNDCIIIASHTVSRFEHGVQCNTCTSRHAITR